MDWVCGYMGRKGRRRRWLNGKQHPWRQTRPRLELETEKGVPLIGFIMWEAVGGDDGEPSQQWVRCTRQDACLFLRVAHFLMETCMHRGL